MSRGRSEGREQDVYVCSLGWHGASPVRLDKGAHTIIFLHCHRRAMQNWMNATTPKRSRGVCSYERTDVSKKKDGAYADYNQQELALIVLCAVTDLHVRGSTAGTSDEALLDAC